MKTKRKKKLNIISIIVIICILGIGSYFSMYIVAQLKKTTSNNVVGNNSKIKNIIQQQNNNEINGIDLGVLTKEQFNQASSLGEKYKNKNLIISGINFIQKTDQEFKNTYVSNIGIWTPYVKVVNASAELAKNYTTINEDNMINKVKNDQINLNSIFCSAMVGGDELDFVKNDNLVVIITNNDDTQKILHPIHTSSEMANDVTTIFFPYSPVYQGNINAEFDISGLNNIKNITVKVIQPNNPEVEGVFNYNKINQL